MDPGNHEGHCREKSGEEDPALYRMRSSWWKRLTPKKQTGIGTWSLQVSRGGAKGCVPYHVV